VSDIRYESFCDIEKHSGSDWVLQSTEAQNKERAKIFFNKNKALKIAKILSEQIDEEGYSGNYEIEELK